MRQLQLGATVPHAPLLVPQVVGDGVSRATAATRDALAAIDLSDCDVVVILSPHGSRSGVYTHCTGDLRCFGAPAGSVSLPTDRAVVASLARLWGEPVVDERVDHGVVVPLQLLKIPDVPVVAAAVGEGLRTADAVTEGHRLAAAVRELAASYRVGFLASMNTAASLSARAPLTERAEGNQLDEQILESLRGGARVEGIDEQMWERAGSCGAAPLAAFAALCPTPAEVLSYEHPFGVGYLVARAT